jgi:hypothetical protein
LTKDRTYRTVCVGLQLRWRAYLRREKNTSLLCKAKGTLPNKQITHHMDVYQKDTIVSNVQFLSDNRHVLVFYGAETWKYPGGQERIPAAATRVILWDFETEKPKYTWNFKAGSKICGSLSPDEKTVWVGVDRTLYHYDLSTGKQLKEWTLKDPRLKDLMLFKRRPAMICSIASLADGKLLITMDTVNYYIFIADSKNEKLVFFDPCRHISGYVISQPGRVSADGKWCALQYQLLDVENNRVIPYAESSCTKEQAAKHPGAVTSMSPDAKRIYVKKRNTAYGFERKTMKQLFPREPAKLRTRMERIFFLDDGDTVVLLTGTTGTLHRLSMKRKEFLPDVKIENHAQYGGLAYVQDVGRSRGEVLCDTSTGAEKKEWVFSSRLDEKKYRVKVQPASDLSSFWGPDYRTILSGVHWDSRAKWWKWDTQGDQEPQEIPGPQWITPNGKRVTVGSRSDSLLHAPDRTQVMLAGRYDYENTKNKLYIWWSPSFRTLGWVDVNDFARKAAHLRFLFSDHRKDRMWLRGDDPKIRGKQRHIALEEMKGLHHPLQMRQFPRMAAKPMEKRELKRLITRLGSNQYKVRSKANNELDTLVDADVEKLKNWKIHDPEIKASIREFAERYRKDPMSPEEVASGTVPHEIALFSDHPDGVHWVAYGQETLTLGRIKGKELECILTTPLPHGISAMAFSPKGILLICTTSGVVELYRVSDE